MALRLTKISGDTPINGFDEIYNRNNNSIISYITSLEDRIRALETENNRMKILYNNKIREIEDKINQSYIDDNVYGNIEVINEYIKTHGDIVINN